MPDVASIQTFPSGVGFTFYRITPTGLVQRPAIEPVQAERDWSFTRRGPADLRDAGWPVRSR